MAWGSVVSVVMLLVSWLSVVFKCSLLDWELGRRTYMKCAKEVYKTFPGPQLFISSPPVISESSARYWQFICCVDPMHLWFCPFTTRTSHRGGHYPRGISENKTSNIIVLTSARWKCDFPWCWLCCHIAKAIIWSCLAGTLLPGHSAHREAKLKGVKRLRQCCKPLFSWLASSGSQEAQEILETGIPHVIPSVMFHMRKTTLLGANNYIVRAGVNNGHRRGPTFRK